MGRVRRFIASLIGLDHLVAAADDAATELTWLVDLYGEIARDNGNEESLAALKLAGARLDRLVEELRRLD